ncbi:MAG: ABC-F family ATP-binding cassette domain-containing protein [Neomegalonema sp.]|nr:ABC-F family ATP-binding cassette domain-containing protein [Neomegalonema sp.]
MLQLSEISFSIAGRQLFDQASATIPTGHRVGVLGRNGTGKSTLFSLILGERSLDGGAIEVPTGWRIGAVAQEAGATRVSLLDTVLEADTERSALLAEAETAQDPGRIAEIQMRLTDIDAYSAEARAGTILTGLGFDAASQARPCAEFSGGWRMRVALAAALFSQPDILLLDEPTNYLDLEGAAWLEAFLARYPRTCLIISHDRALLNRSVGGILHLQDRKLSYYAVPYDKFDAMRREKALQQVAAKKRQDAQRAHIQSFVDRFRAKATKAKQAQSRLKMLERMQPIADSREADVAGFNFPKPDELSPPLIALRGLDAGYPERTVLKGLNLRIDNDDRIALLGANGQGKSTLAKVLAKRLTPLAGEIIHHSKLKVGFFAQHQLDELRPEETPVQHIARLRPEEPPARLRARLGSAGIGADIAETQVERLSGGQKARLAMMLATIDAPHLLILDEPTNHLDIESREALSLALNDYSGAVILISHDSHLVESVADRLWLVNGGTVSTFEEDMDAYRKMLLSQRRVAGNDDSKDEAAENQRKSARRDAASRRKDLAPLRKKVSESEARIEKLEEMLATIDARLADPSLYEKAAQTIEATQQKRGEILKGLERAEELWANALADLESAEAALD